MQAKISYTLELDRIPSEVNRLLMPTIEDVKGDLKDGIYVDKNNVELSISKIDFLRKQLLKLDTRLSECYSILQGYLNAHMQSDLQEKEEDGQISE